MANYDIGIDLGTTSIIVAVAGQGVVLSESSVVKWLILKRLKLRKVLGL